VRRGALIGLGAVAGAAALAHRAAWGEPRDLVLPEHDVRVPHWPPALAGMRIALVSDLHAGGPHVRERRVAAVVDAVHAAEPDLVVLLGDYVDTRVRGARRVRPDVVASILSRLRAPAGVVAVLGNHDWIHEGHEMGDALRRAGVVLLENSAVRRRFRDERFWVAGVADLTERHARVGHALSAVPHGDPVLLLSHNPDVFPHVPDRVTLTLSGHTHGAQVDLPLLSRAIIPSRYGDRYHSGLVVEHGRTLFVSRGVGSTGAPVRLFARPEVPLLRLLPAGTAH
jgi:predicted MPP superfamily phosphohydrolase